MGAIAFSPDIYHAWASVYSRLLAIILPLAVALDLDDKDQSGCHSADRQNDFFENVRTCSDEIMEANLTRLAY